MPNAQCPIPQLPTSNPQRPTHNPNAHLRSSALGLARYNQKSLRKLKDESLSESKLHQLIKLHTGRKAWFARLLEP